MRMTVMPTPNSQYNRCFLAASQSGFACQIFTRWVQTEITVGPGDPPGGLKSQASSRMKHLVSAKSFY